MLAIDTLWGIERTKDSEFFGKIVVPVIVFWDRPGANFAGEDNGAKVSGALGHGAEIFIIGEAEYEGFKWSKVEADVWLDGKNYYQSGWIRNSLLKFKGAIEYADD